MEGLNKNINKIGGISTDGGWGHSTKIIDFDQQINTP